MKRLLALLLLAVAPAFGQGLPPSIPTYDPTVEQTYTVTQPQTPLQNINQNSIGIPLTLYDDGSTFQPIDLQFDFYFFGSLFDSVYISQNGLISFTSNANGCCSGNELPFLSNNSYWNMNNSIFAMWSDLADFNNPGNPYYKSTGNSFTVGWYGVDELGSGYSNCNEFGCTQGPGNKFTFEISLFADSSFSINYGSFDYNNQTGRTFTSGFQGDTATEYNQFYWGSNPSSLQNTTYFVQSSEIVPLQPDPPIAPDCTVNPNDPTCIINDLTDFTDEEPIYVADESTGADDGSIDGTEVVEENEESVVEEMLANDDLIDEELLDEELLDEEEMSEEESLEELLADEDEEEIAEEERIVVYRELTDEEKAAILADAISKTTLEAALSVATDAVSSATTVSSATEVVSSESSSRSSTSTDASSESVATTETVVAMESTSETSKEESTDSSALAALDILETGRQLGQEALATTLASSESSANDSIAEAQSIASTSSGDTQSSGGSADVLIVSTTAETNPTDTSNQTVEQIETETATTEQFVAEAEQSTEKIMQTQEAPSAVDSTGAEQSLEVFASNSSSAAVVAAEQEELENSIVQQAIAASQTNEEENKMGFAEAEAVTIASDPALANAFNVQPNTASLELLGVLGSRAEERSDAELRAEQVVAANKEQQDAINANYMEADQSGILAAIGSETDVTSYRTAMIRDNDDWYKPEDIYKGIIIKDNVRGSYFLEKGNTDTYKKMVEEQYK
jgi:hypothetical protein